MIKTYEEIEGAMRDGYEPNALDRFVLNNEPAGEEDARNFHMDLQALVEYVQIETPGESDD